MTFTERVAALERGLNYIFWNPTARRLTKVLQGLSPARRERLVIATGPSFGFFPGAYRRRVERVVEELLVHVEHRRISLALHVPGGVVHDTVLLVTVGVEVRQEFGAADLLLLGALVLGHRIVGEDLALEDPHLASSRLAEILVRNEKIATQVSAGLFPSATESSATLPLRARRKFE